MAAVEFRPVDEAIAEELVENIRPVDAMEWRALVCEPSSASLMAMVKESHRSGAVLLDGRVAGVFGVERQSLLSTEAVIWFLGTRVMETKEARREFIRRAPAGLARLVDGYSRGWNCVAARNALAIRWLRHMGASFGEPFHVGGVPFVRFDLEF